VAAWPPQRPWLIGLTNALVSVCSAASSTASRRGVAGTNPAVTVATRRTRPSG
jgi:hypothetical protein